MTVTSAPNNARTGSGNSNQVMISIPASITVDGGSSWNGVVELPTVKSTSTVTLPSSSGTTNTAQLVIEMGSSVTLTFNNAVRLLLVGKAGTHVGFYHDPTSVTEITQACSDDTQATNNGLPAGGNCKIDVGSDLVVWTKHFTGFATWSSSTSSTSAAAGAASGGSSAAVGQVPQQL